jgi:site-specific recombinase XerC
MITFRNWPKGIDMSGGNPGLKIESAAGVTARDMMQKHLSNFAYVIRTDRFASRSTVAAYVDGLAGAVALTVAGGHGDRSEVIEATIKTLRESVDRDLKHMARQ